MQCPACQFDGEPRALRFTWWGGVLGAKLLHHVECVQCRARFNGRTGRSNSTGIAIYLIVASAVALALVYWFMQSSR